MMTWTPPQPDSTNDPTSDFDPGDLNEHEQQDAAFQAELSTCTRAFWALDQLGSDLDIPLETGSNEKLGNTPADLFCIENVKLTQEFIDDISTAMFENGCLDDNIIHCLHNPCDEVTSISDPDIHLSLDLFLAITNTSKETYHACRSAILCHYPNSGVLPYHAVKGLVAETTDVVTIYDDICINSCHAFIGPFAQLQSCSLCGEARYDVNQAALTGKNITR
jgi:hypothetical protein